MGIVDFLRVAALRKLIIGWCAAVGLAVGLVLAVALPPHYASSAKVQVDSIQRNMLTGIAEPRLRVAEYLGQQAAVASSRTVAIEVIRRLEADGAFRLADYEERWRTETGGERTPGNDARLWAADQLLRDLTVKADDIGSTIEFVYRADDPAVAAQIANAFAGAYMSILLDHKQRRYARKAADFSQETHDLAESVADAQQELAAYREQSGILPMGLAKAEATEIELEASTDRLAQARADLAEARSLLRQAEATPRGALVNFPIPIDALAGREAQDRLADVSAGLARVEERFGRNYPDYLELAREKAALEDIILQSVRERAAFAERRVAALDAQAQEQKAAVAALRKSREAYDLLEKKAAASREAYDLVTARSLQESLQSRIDTLDVFLLAQATPPARPSTPPATAVALIGLAVGVAVGAFAALFVELLEGRVRTAAIIRKTFRTYVSEIAAPPGAPRRPAAA
jgi:uncharacterized protein involved in exopolysaccharide biosynthesis